MTTSGPRFGERAEFGENDVCYRHPARQSFTLCQRCGRTICADCQIVSPVGLLCRDCTKQTGAAGLSAGKRMTRGARVRARKFAALDTPVTYTIIAANVLVFALQLLSYYFGNNGVTTALWYSPMYSLPPGVHEVSGGVIDGYPNGVMLSTVFEPWRILTATFTHSVTWLFHIIFNMLTLFLFGRHLETMIGKWRYLALYLIAGIGGSLAVMLWGYADSAQMFSTTVGASGAIFGVLGATVVAFRVMNVNATSLIVMIAISLGMGFLPGRTVSWQAHLGGVIVGAIAMWIILRTRGPRKKKQQVLALSLLGAVVVLLTGAFFVVSPF